MGPGDLPDRAVVALEAGGVHPVPRLVLLPDLNQAAGVFNAKYYGPEWEWEKANAQFVFACADHFRAWLEFLNGLDQKRVCPNSHAA